MQYLGERGLPRARLFADAPSDGSDGSDAARIRWGLQRAAGETSRLEDVLEGVRSWIPAHHRAQPRGRSALFALPRWLGEASSCTAIMDREGLPADEPEGAAAEFGRHFASAFRFETGAGEPAILHLGWEREGGAWRIFAFRVVEP